MAPVFPEISRVTPGGAAPGPGPRGPDGGHGQRRLRPGPLGPSVSDPAATVEVPPRRESPALRLSLSETQTLRIHLAR